MLRRKFPEQHYCRLLQLSSLASFLEIEGEEKRDVPDCFLQLDRSA